MNMTFKEAVEYEIHQHKNYIERLEQEIENNDIEIAYKKGLIRQYRYLMEIFERELLKIQEQEKNNE